MAKIIDPDSLSVAVNTTATTEEVEIQTAAKTIELRVAGNLDDSAPGRDSGVTAKALYSFLKEEWLANSTLRRHRFPLKMIFEGSFIFINGWAPLNDQTRDLFRDAGFLEQATSQENACIISLGSVVNSGADQGYYQQTSGFSAAVTNFDKTGELNENLVIVGSGGTPDNTGYLKLHLREQGLLYAEYNLLSEQGLAALTYQAYRLPLANSLDLKITESDANIDANSPYTGMKVNYLKGVGFTTWANSTVYPAAAVVKDNLTGRWYFSPAGGTSSGTSTADDTGVTDWEAYDGEEQIGANYYAFNRVITCNGGTKEEVHEWAMRQLRKTSDINADDTPSVNQQGFGTVNGNVAKFLTEFVGDTLKPFPGVVVRGFDANDTNSITHRPITVDGGGVDSEFTPLTTAEVSFPFVAAGTFNFSSNLVAEPDVDTVYTAYFDYITTVTNSGIAITNSAGATADITWGSTTLDHIQNGDWLEISGFANPENNGIWQVTGAPGAGTLPATKRDGTQAPTNEAAGPSVTVLENPFETPGAVVVNDNSATPIDGQISAASIPFDFDYTNNNQGGRTPNTPAPCTVVAMAKDGAEWTEASFTITAATGLNVAINSGDERNYANP